jgi:predicted Rossmann-fold nucleotide-binding protein
MSISPLIIFQHSSKRASTVAAQAASKELAITTGGDEGTLEAVHEGTFVRNLSRLNGTGTVEPRANQIG